MVGCSMRQTISAKNESEGPKIQDCITDREGS